MPGAVERVRSGEVQQVDGTILETSECLVMCCPDQEGALAEVETVEFVQRTGIVIAIESVAFSIRDREAA